MEIKCILQPKMIYAGKYILENVTIEPLNFADSDCDGPGPSQPEFRRAMPLEPIPNLPVS